MGAEPSSGGGAVEGQGGVAVVALESKAPAPAPVAGAVPAARPRGASVGTGAWGVAGIPASVTKDTKPAPSIAPIAAAASAGNPAPVVAAVPAWTPPPPVLPTPTPAPATPVARRVISITPAKNPPPAAAPTSTPAPRPQRNGGRIGAVATPAVSKTASAAGSGSTQPALVVGKIEVAPTFAPSKPVPQKDKATTSSTPSPAPEATRVKRKKSKTRLDDQTSASPAKTEPEPVQPPAPPLEVEVAAIAGRKKKKPKERRPVDAPVATTPTPLCIGPSAGASTLSGLASPTQANAVDPDNASEAPVAAPAETTSPNVAFPEALRETFETFGLDLDLVNSVRSTLYGPSGQDGGPAGSSSRRRGRTEAKEKEKEKDKPPAPQRRDSIHRVHEFEITPYLTGRSAAACGPSGGAGPAATSTGGINSVFDTEALSAALSQLTGLAGLVNPPRPDIPGSGVNIRIDVSSGTNGLGEALLSSADTLGCFTQLELLAASLANFSVVSANAQSETGSIPQTGSINLNVNGFTVNLDPNKFIDQALDSLAETAKILYDGLEAQAQRASVVDRMGRAAVAAVASSTSAFSTGGSKGKGPAAAAAAAAAAPPLVDVDELANAGVSPEHTRLMAEAFAKIFPKDGGGTPIPEPAASSSRKSNKKPGRTTKADDLSTSGWTVEDWRAKVRSVEVVMRKVREARELRVLQKEQEARKTQPPASTSSQSPPPPLPPPVVVDGPFDDAHLTNLLETVRAMVSSGETLKAVAAGGGGGSSSSSRRRAKSHSRTPSPRAAPHTPAQSSPTAAPAVAQPVPAPISPSLADVSALERELEAARKEERALERKLVDVLRRNRRWKAEVGRALRCGVAVGVATAGLDWGEEDVERGDDDGWVDDDADEEGAGGAAETNA
ncbi:hypothetical protein BDK51DRAFT_27289 [Blyttiomyces helicus]|uniref:Uncharacterized protein n=1 Tax=Blyttiomyces helicus TaxID=388810 RepID=A0A4P9WL87_9FUNG|nr:hypothetical protein BDK51DRAFT_27289 [Blyttiomyces helicus]|eukprot:RKO93799.1 hypothetical protein BDK51DRAFT_27289 [Blyttiomyces helicus]